MISFQYSFKQLPEMNFSNSDIGDMRPVVDLKNILIVFDDAMNGIKRFTVNQITRNFSTDIDDNRIVSGQVFAVDLKYRFF